MIIVINIIIDVSINDNNININNHYNMNNINKFAAATLGYCTVQKGTQQNIRYLI